MPNEKLYFGIKNPPKGYKRASAQQALDHNQIRLWGLNKIDSRLLAKRSEDIASEAAYNKKYKELLMKLGIARGTLLRLEKELPYQKTKIDKTNKIKEINAAKKALNKISNDFQKLEQSKG